MFNIIVSVKLNESMANSIGNIVDMAKDLPNSDFLSTPELACQAIMNFALEQDKSFADMIYEYEHHMSEELRYKFLQEQEGK